MPATARLVVNRSITLANWKLTYSRGGKKCKQLHNLGFCATKNESSDNSLSGCFSGTISPLFEEFYLKLKEISGCISNPNDDYFFSRESVEEEAGGGGGGEEAASGHGPGESGRAGAGATRCFISSFQS